MGWVGGLPDQVPSGPMPSVGHTAVPGGGRPTCACGQRAVPLCSFCFSVVVSGAFRGNIRTE